MAGQGVALIVVHGVADQKPGETARALADLMVATEGGHSDRPAGRAAVDYVALASQDIVLTVDPLAPRQRTQTRLDATPRAKDRSFAKAWRQSFRSDFHAEPATAGAADRGIALTDYLLAKHRDNGAGPESYDTRCVQLERRENGNTQTVDLYEMYWADLSRLSGALPRIVTELFTMVFRLSGLGRDTVVEARMALGRRARSLAWRATTASQVVFDWLFANVLALLFAQLFLLAQIFVALGLVTRLESRPLLHLALAGGAGVLAVLVYAYRRRGLGPRFGRIAPPLAVALLAFAAALLPAVQPWLSAALLVAAVTLIYDVVLRVGAERFPFVRIMGLAMWVLVLLLMLASAAHETWVAPAPLDPEIFDVGFHAALFGVELTLLAIKWWWVGAGFLLVLWFVAGLGAWRVTGYESRASLATGRMGLMMSLATFLTLTMAIWALTTKLVEVSSEHVRYAPCIFSFDGTKSADWLTRHEPVRFDPEPAPRPRPAYPPTDNACLWTTADARANAAALRSMKPAAQTQTGALFLRDRYVNSTAGFAFLSAVLLLLIAYLVSMFTPSVLAELKLLAVRATKKAHDRVMRRRRVAVDDGVERVRRLGRWLTAGYRKLDAVIWTITAIGVVLALIVSMVYADELFVGRAPDFVPVGDDWVRATSQVLLRPLVLTTAGLVTLLTVFGGLLSKYLPELRAPLDVALDVDNHFREFPRTGIPRARIFSRYAALLRHVQSQKYERIVIVSHSQGTVITADLLRFLSSPDGGAPQPGQWPLLEGRHLPPVSLLTLGCPLRQLYAARFPTLYRWMIWRRGAVVGPVVSDIGVTRWINAFCSGDYVGRWLWSDSPDLKDDVGHPMLDAADRSDLGRKMAYDGFVPVPPAAAPFGRTAEVEVCIGFGAHTHYLEGDQLQVAWLIDNLVGPLPIATP